MLFLHKKKEVIGIDIGSSSVKLVQLKELKDSYQLLAAGLLPLPPEAIIDNTLIDSGAVVAVVQKLASSLGVSRIKNVACSISGNSVIIRKISLPAMSAEELEEQIVWEAEQYIPFDINDVNIDFQILGPDGMDPSKMDVLLVACKKNIINDYTTLFNEAGLHLSIVDVDAFAIQNAFEMNHDAAPGEVLALINIGAAIMNINIIKDGGTLFTRDVQMGGNLYTEEIQKQMGLSAPEAESLKLRAGEAQDGRLLELLSKVNETISQEIRRSLDFYNSSASDDRISRMYVSGGCSKTCNLVATVSDKVGLPVEMINPFARVRYSEKAFDPEYLQAIGPLMAVCVGLAARKAGDK
jgi:type IV pilus assembly protein PilM